MNEPHFLNSDIINFAILPILIFLIRIVDVSIGTIRIIFISRDIRFLSALFGSIEVLIWLFAITQIMRNLNSPIYYVAYAAGFGMGTFVGITIERRFSYGNRSIRVITRQDASELIKDLRESGYAVTSINGEGLEGPVKLIFTIVKRNQVSKAIEAIKQFNPNAFYTVEDIRFARDTNMHPLQTTTRKKFFQRFGAFFITRK